MQTALTRIWTQFAWSIFYIHNHNAMNASDWFTFVFVLSDLIGVSMGLRILLFAYSYFVSVFLCLYA